MTEQWAAQETDGVGESRMVDEVVVERRHEVKVVDALGRYQGGSDDGQD